MKVKIAQIILGLAEYYDKTINENQLSMYVEDLSFLTPEELSYAVKEYRINPENKFFPLPAKLIELVNPFIDPEDEARDVASLIIAAVSSCGYTNPGRAEREIGELGWTVIKRMGGWLHLCENLNANNEGMYRAQIRDYAQTVAKKAARGELDQRPQLPTPHAQEIQKMLTASLKGIE